MQHNAAVHTGRLIPPPEVFTCESPRVLWVEVGQNDEDVAHVEAIIRQADGLEFVRFCHNGRSKEPESLLLLIRAASESHRIVELFSSLLEFEVSKIGDLVRSGLECLCVIIQPASDEELDGLRARLAVLHQTKLLLGMEKPEIQFSFEMTTADTARLPDIVRLADESAVERVTLYPKHSSMVDRTLTDLLPRLRREFPMVSIDASTCEDDPHAPLNSHPRFTGRPIAGAERVFSCVENPWDSVRLLANGDLVTCALRPDAVMGNVKRLPLQQIWRNPAYNAFRHQYQLGTDSVSRLCPRKLAYMPGPIRSVVRPQQGNTIELVEGWHWSEGEIVWSKRRGRCLLGSAHDAETQEEAVRCVEVEGLLPCGTAATPNELSVWQMERKLGSFCNSSGTIQPFHMLLPFTDASGVAQLEFTTSGVYRPRVSGSPDRRDLGFALQSLRSVVPPDRRLPRWQYLPLYVSLELGGRLAPLFRHPKPALRRLPSWRPGMTIIIPECGTPGLLRHAIASTVAAAARLAEDTEIIVVVNGAAVHLYDEHRREFRMVRWLYSKKALGYCGAVAIGLRRARFDWVYLLNSDMTLAEGALAEVARWRLPHVFAVSSQVFFADPKRRREETGWTDCSISEDGKVELFDAAPEDQLTVRGHLYAGGGNSLFRADLLRKFLSRSHCYGPAYWEDVEWGVRAWREGFEVLFCPASHVTHVHRATVSRLFSAEELERIWKRNQLLFSVRNGFSRLPARQLVRSFRSTLDLITQRELITLHQAVSLFLALVDNARAPAPAADLSRTCRKYYLSAPARPPSRPTALVVSPFAVYPKGHGGARRIASLIEQLSQSLDIILLSDEDTEYRLEHIVSARGPVSIHLTGGRLSPSAFALDRVGRIQSHSHDRLRVEMERLALVYNVMLIQIEHVELAGLAGSFKSRAPRVIDLHDVLLSDGSPSEEDRVEQDLIARHEAVLTSSHEDARLLRHPRIAIVPNGFTRRPLRYSSSRGNRMILFAGPFRFKPNLLGIVAFLERVYPYLLREVPGLELTILGGRESRYVAAQYPCFEQRGVTMIEQTVEIEPWYERCAVTINPVPETRGSCVKVIESIGFGRVCISTEVGARSFRGLGVGSLITVPCVNDFRAPLQRLLLDEDSRIRLERPDDRVLSGLTWESVGRGLLDTYQRWFWSDSAKASYCRRNIE